MANYSCRNCDCTEEIFAGHKRPTHCDHGNLFEKARPDGESKPRRRPKKQSEPKRDWTDANAKVEIEGRCRVCGWEGEGLERAHIMGRRYDQPVHTGTRTLYVNPLDVLPLCPVFAPEKCHHRYDHRELDLLPFLAPEEQTRAVEVAGGIEAARKRVAPLRHREEVEESAWAPVERSEVAA
jgi:hypothetical protein